MAKSRKDSRGYVLRTGESQRKDGRYSYSYTDLDKNRRTVYAKTLVELRVLQRILFDAIICRIRKIKTSHF
ncbi:integrase DNA-binding domain-containing protein [Mediterraneibacter gnavus]|uniref:integrase DNA-binding domain-containing protein n=1 Tax=Mediterraneibacter gnavus TaxID=33038 RepID=UPI00233010AA|nr:integrase DNA-binding domain-containing protein [Mediterraneibacter gnavus]MDB8684229.1 integrase DNA-binding domain-containing protein [Mediterraneibacter gnavus]MDB8695162.1 integrase DNA-binding domain-containing protein [Mediterraneibacter gnavus]MDB8701249.1 integrase DNA-binding domain-containing protein [Mediterraneibacter gnavus]